MNLPHDKFCVLPWVSLEASPIGTVRPCCLADDEILVFVQAMTAESVVIEVQAWFTAESWSAYLPVRSALFLDTLRAVRARGVKLAAPIRVLRTEA